LPDELIVGPSVAGAGMTFARAGHGLMRGGWRCLVRFRFVGGNFVGGSMSISAVPRCVAAADVDTNRTANSS
jgi:hypothetical protein